MPDWIAKEERRSRRRDMVMTVLSAIFVVAGLVVIGFGEIAIGGLAALFFGGCTLIGFMQLAGPHTQAGQRLLLAGSLLMGAGSLALLLLVLDGMDTGHRARGTMIVASAIGTVLFGLGGPFAYVLNRRRRRR
ncbi:hypothetical protein [Pseudactinotalea sp.]|uniref:hypothetical protein n=1 Tax=Pseudactinotalea sp. TaxID=1926260 RepID=UPI003B3A1F3A